MHLGALSEAAAGGAAVLAGAVNAMAGGGTLISFPALVALGVPAVNANITNTVSLLPGYLAGSFAQRDDLRPQLLHAKLLSAVSAVGGLVGSILLVILPASAFRASVPYLILLSCALLAFGDRLRFSARPGADAKRGPSGGRQVLFVSSIFLGAAYGGFFGAGLGIMLLALLALFSLESLTKLNALKQALSFLINLVAAAFFLFSGKVTWILVPIMAVGSLLGGFLGGRLVKVIDPSLLRRVVVAAGVAVAISFWVG